MFYIFMKKCFVLLVSIEKLKQYKFYENFLERKHRQAYTYVYQHIYVTQSDDAVVL